MGLKHVSNRLSKTDLAHLGSGEVGYIRKMRSDEVSRCFPKRRPWNRGSTSGRCSAPTARRSF